MSALTLGERKGLTKTGVVPLRPLRQVSPPSAPLDVRSRAWNLPLLKSGASAFLPGRIAVSALRVHGGVWKRFVPGPLASCDLIE